MPDSKGEWLAATPAADLLGVDSKTLSRYALEGTLPEGSWRWTPGGKSGRRHRRYHRPSIEKFAATLEGTPGDRGGPGNPRP
jgi:hypothetical protein